MLVIGPGLKGSDDINNYEGIYRWAKKHYLTQKYRATAQKLELLLAFINQDKVLKASPRLMGKIWLLLGAAKEKTGHIKDAQHYYLLAKEAALSLKDRPEAWIQEINFQRLPIYLKMSPPPVALDKH